MDIYIFALKGPYAGGLALVSAPSKQEAVSILARAEENSFQVEGYEYETDESGDLVHPTNKWHTIPADRRYVLVKSFYTQEPQGVVALAGYAE